MNLVGHESCVDKKHVSRKYPYDVVVIDGSAKTEGMLGAAVRVSDVVAIPVQPTPADIWGAADVVDLIRRTGTPAGFVVSRAITGTNLAAEIQDALADYDIPVIEGRTSQRVAYAEAMISGSTVLKAPPPARPPAKSGRLSATFSASTTDNPIGYYGQDRTHGRARQKEAVTFG